MTRPINGGRRPWTSKSGEAIDAYRELIKRGGSRADGAMYWTAYALSKLGQQAEGLATLEQLRKSHPNSRWLNDAQALEVDMRRLAGQPVAPESQTDEELKLLAISGRAGTGAAAARKSAPGRQRPPSRDRRLLLSKYGS